MKPIFQKNLQFGDIWPWNRQKIAQIEVFGHFLDFASLVFLDFAHNHRWTWCLVVFLQFAGPVNAFLFPDEMFFLLKRVPPYTSLSQLVHDADCNLAHASSNSTWTGVFITKWSPLRFCHDILQTLWIIISFWVWTF